MTFKERGAIGDDAERRAEDYFKAKDLFIVRYGLDAKELKGAYESWQYIPSVVANTPDYIVVAKKKSYFLEVKACGKVLKMKMHDISNYKQWNRNIFKDMRLVLFIYSITEDKQYILSLDKLLNLIESNNYSIDRYENNKKPYYIIPLEDL